MIENFIIKNDKDWNEFLKKKLPRDTMGTITIDSNRSLVMINSFPYPFIKITAIKNSSIILNAPIQIVCKNNVEIKAKDGVVVATDFVKVMANGTSSVYAHEDSIVWANDSSNIYAFGSSGIYACDKTKVSVQGKANITAGDHINDEVVVTVWSEQVIVTAKNNTIVYSGLDYPKDRGGYKVAPSKYIKGIETFDTDGSTFKSI